jgi:hypothetical protein
MYVLIIRQISHAMHSIRNVKTTNNNFSDLGMPNLLITDGSLIPNRIRATTNRKSGFISFMISDWYFLRILS